MEALDRNKPVIRFTGDAKPYRLISVKACSTIVIHLPRAA
jgi:hypothetical protein